ncbi:MAG: hypothetical protein JWR27_1550 [Aeromicrobium sp.]|nr:hypothetical protein [Aeromicrobium sp.]
MTLAVEPPDQWSVVREDLTDLRVLDADAVVLGSAIYYGHWMRQAARALEFLRDCVPQRVWLLSTAPISQEETENAQVISADAMADVGETDEHMVFGGNLQTADLTFEHIAGKLRSGVT